MQNSVIGGGLLSSTNTLDHDSSYTSTAESNSSSPQFCLAVHQSVADILNPEPKSYKQVLSSPDKDAWTNAINSELNSIINDKEALKQPHLCLGSIFLEQQIYCHQGSF